VLGLGDEIGRIEAGRRADIITIDLQQPHLMPTFDIEAALVYSARGGDVRDSIIDGRLVMRDRQILSVDEPALLEEVRRVAASVAAKAGIDLPGAPALAAE
jgi:5-methylthioadenosine/S-adenosylhomocysteine deaminase